MIGIGLIGCGAWGLNYLKTFAEIPEANILHVCDQNENILEELSSNYPQIRTTTNYQDLLDDEQVSGAVIATPPQSHFAIAANFLMRNKAVLVEKPITLSYIDTDRLIKLSQKNNTLLMAGHIMEYHPAVVKLQDYINQGILGELRYILLERANLGKIRSDVSVLWDLAVHDLSIVRYLVNQEPRWVSAHGESYLQDGIHDIVAINMGFANNLFVKLHCNWMYPLKRRQIIVAGGRTMAALDDTRDDFKLQIIPYNGDITMPKLERTPPLTSQCKHFVDCLQTGDEPKTGVRDMAWVMKVMDLIEQSLFSNSARLHFR
ncbi:oxidoreductase domain protein [Desulfofarcimen acetoxidans DSM 771]|jgi:predicted dehydrogenase|uniref:Oxidoreductase domain protein n=1 Tax=Desulfofarcimen acetoxidans (strain ATCC 49208 / DSM 771 / KCTC 5769 / VKM B-1644 / 5575) TaxID=485916 RepID=C8W4F7_DESAS|nr:Gfo/Idh/MocA family oxidoreductase [Desulfofarcimen acetoxidans]ACV62025.1 oxidoreductase domain protein [Desulfofarcimen acetoxidans DSM 771]